MTTAVSRAIRPYAKPECPQYRAWRQKIHMRFVIAARRMLAIRGRRKPGALPKKNSKARQQLAVELRKARVEFWAAWREYPEVKHMNDRGAYIAARRFLAAPIEEDQE